MKVDHYCVIARIISIWDTEQMESGNGASMKRESPTGTMRSGDLIPNLAISREGFEDRSKVVALKLSTRSVGSWRSTSSCADSARRTALNRVVALYRLRLGVLPGCVDLMPLAHLAAEVRRACRNGGQALERFLSPDEHLSYLSLIHI